MPINSLRFRGLARAALVAACMGMCIGVSSCTQEEVARYSIAQVFPFEQQDTAVRVAKCESRFDPEARNGRIYGVFQIHESNRAYLESLGFDWERVKVETYTNVMAAYELWKLSGWRPWQCK